MLNLRSLTKPSGQETKAILAEKIEHGFQLLRTQHEVHLVKMARNFLFNPQIEQRAQGDDSNKQCTAEPVTRHQCS